MVGFGLSHEREVHAGRVWHVVEATFTAPDGSLFQRDIVRSPGAVGVVPVAFDAQGHPSVVLLRQYRPPYDEEIIEIPAGMRDVPGEPPEETARRELVEEAGLLAGGVDHLTDMYPSPGMTDSVTSLFLATDCTPAERSLHGPEEVHSEVMHVPLVEAVDMIDRGEIRDAKTVIALLMLARRLAESATS